MRYELPIIKVRIAFLTLGFFLCPPLYAEKFDLDAGRERAESFCSRCHGIDGISKNELVPNLAGQKMAYMVNQLNAFRKRLRRSTAMRDVVRVLNDEDIVNVSAYYSQLPNSHHK